MQRHVYHLEVHFVSTASRGKAAPEVMEQQSLVLKKKLCAGARSCEVTF